MIDVLLLDRQRGKTTALLHEVIDLLAATDSKVVIVVPDASRVGAVASSIRELGRGDVRIVTFRQLRYMRGHLGPVVIDDIDSTEHGIWDPALECFDVRLVTATPARRPVPA